jgi:inhibitor of cysteine peptidase
VVRRLLILVITVLTSVISMEATQTTPSVAAKKTSVPSVIVTEQSKGKDVDLTSGELLIVKLGSNRSTGYSWSVSGDPAPLKLEKMTYQRNSKLSPVVGAPGVQVFQFNAGSAGMTTLNIVYRRSWEYNVPPAKTFSVRVNVR